MQINEKLIVFFWWNLFFKNPSNISCIIFLLFFYNIFKSSVCCLAFLIDHWSILTRTSQQIISQISYCFDCALLKFQPNECPKILEKKMFKLIISKLFYLIWHSDFKIIGLRMVLNIISSYCQQVTRNNWFHCHDHVYTRSFLPKYRMKLLFDNSESFICAGHSILLCTYSS